MAKRNQNNKDSSMKHGENAHSEADAPENQEDVSSTTELEQDPTETPSGEESPVEPQLADNVGSAETTPAVTAEEETQPEDGGVVTEATTGENDDEESPVESQLDEELSSDEDALEEQSTTTPEPVAVETEKVYIKPDDIMATLGDESIGDLRARIAYIGENASGVIKMLVGKLLAYNESMKPGAPSVSPQIAAGKNYDLLNTLKMVINEESYNDFKLKFDLINIIFKEFGNESFSESMLHRHDTEWRWGKDTLVTYQNLVTMITVLADLNTRAVNKKRINLDLAFDKAHTVFTDASIKNIKQYYA